MEALNSYERTTVDNDKSATVPKIQPKIILDLTLVGSSSPREKNVKTRTKHVLENQHQEQLERFSGRYKTSLRLTDQQTVCHFIDNSGRVYFPVNLACGVQALCRPDVLLRCRAILNDINTDIKNCLRILPPSVHCLILRTKIWVNCSYSFGPEDRPVVLNHTAAHHHEDWLLWAGDRPDKSLGIEIYNCFDFRRMRLHWNGCGLLLHELCHLIHQKVLPDGLDNEVVKDAFRCARQSGLYEEILRRDWAGKDTDHDLAYAMVDHKEFFAEMSVAFWSRGYCDLNTADRKRMDLCSPPILEPIVYDRLQDRAQNLGDVDYERLLRLKQIEKYLQNDQDIFKSLFSSCFCFTEKEVVLSHCNKFYPFTSGQLDHHDPNLYSVMSMLWSEIASWEDPVDDANCDFNLCDCLAPWKKRTLLQATADV